MARRRVTAEELERMPTSEIRAVASQRGYRISAGAAHHVLIVGFMVEQDRDAGLVEEEAAIVLPTVEEAPSIDPARTDGDLLEEFAKEATDRGYAAEQASSIAQGRLLDLRSGGDGYTVRAAPETPTAPAPLEPSITPVSVPVPAHAPAAIPAAVKHASQAKPKPAKPKPVAKIPEEG